MKAIIHRLRRLEGAKPPVEAGHAVAELIRAKRRRRLEESGQPDEDLPPVDYTGCRTIADRILRSRQARMEHQRTLRRA